MPWANLKKDNFKNEKLENQIRKRTLLYQARVQVSRNLINPETNLCMLPAFLTTLTCFAFDSKTYNQCHFCDVV